MVCQPKAQGEIDAALGVTTTVGTPTWSQELYSCRYELADGAFVLSVKELSSWPQTLRYYDGLGSTLGEVTRLFNLGQGAFQTRDSSVVVRKDWKVLLVDVSDLPAQVGNPATPQANAALVVADVILGCWHGD